jgi:hypothetical protein
MKRQTKWKATLHTYTKTRSTAKQPVAIIWASLICLIWSFKQQETKISPAALSRIKRDTQREPRAWQQIRLPANCGNEVVHQEIDKARHRFCRAPVGLLYKSSFIEGQGQDHNNTHVKVHSACTKQTCKLQNFEQVVRKMLYLERSIRDIYITYSIHKCVCFASDQRVEHARAIRWIGGSHGGIWDKALIYQSNKQASNTFQMPTIQEMKIQMWSATHHHAKDRTSFTMQPKGSQKPKTVAQKWEERLGMEVATRVEHR